MKKPATLCGGLINLFAYPIHLLSDKLKVIKKQHKKPFSFCLGLVLLFLGAFLAHLKQLLMPEFAWEGITYSIHGMGCAPIIKIVFDAIDIEI